MLEEGMNKHELMDFLGKARMGVVGTLRKDGYPQVTPVWYRYDGETITIWTQKDRMWVKNLVRDPRVAFSAQDEAPPFSGVVMRGKAEVITEESQAVLEEIRKVTRRYIDEKEMEAYIKQYWPQLQTIVRIVPEAVTSWKLGY